VAVFEDGEAVVVAVVNDVANCDVADDGDGDGWVAVSSWGAVCNGVDSGGGGSLGSSFGRQ
jgi:hypothetical protein